jgi:chromosomal replication initiator protein
MICSNQNNDYDSERNERRDDARIGQYKNSQITILAIQEKVSHYYDISIDDILSDVRARNLSLPRQVAMYLTKKLTSLSLMEIAKQFGGKNHSTIIHGISKIESTIKNNLALSGDIDNIVKSLKLN